MEFFQLLHGFVKIDICISLGLHMHLSKLLHGFVKVVLCISGPLPKFEQYFKLVEASALN